MRRLDRRGHSDLLAKMSVFYPKREQYVAGSRREEGWGRGFQKGREGSKRGFLTYSHTAQAEAQQQREEYSHVALSEGAGRSGPWAGSCRDLGASPTPAWTNVSTH